MEYTRKRHNNLIYSVKYDHISRSSTVEPLSDIIYLRSRYPVFDSLLVLFLEWVFEKYNMKYSTNLPWPIIFHYQAQVFRLFYQKSKVLHSNPYSRIYTIWIKNFIPILCPRFSYYFGKLTRHIRTIHISTCPEYLVSNSFLVKCFLGQILVMPYLYIDQWYCQSEDLLW